MRSRLAQWGVLVTGLLALFGLATPRPAQAHTTASITFDAVATLTAGIGAPGTDPVLPLVPTPTLVVLELHGDPPGVNANMHIEWDRPHNRRGVVIQDTLCTINGGNGPNKQGMATGFIHDCDFLTFNNPAKPDFTENYVQGYCGLNGGQASLFLIDSLGQLFVFDLHFSGQGGTITFTGHWGKVGDPEQHGKLIGETAAATDTIGGGGSCLDKTATRFLLAGTASMTPDLTLLIV